MTIDELSKALKVSKNYILSHWYTLAERQEKNGIILRKSGVGNNTIYFVDNLPCCNMNLGDAAKELGYSPQFLKKNFYSIKEKKAKDGILISKLGSGEATEYGIFYT